MNDPRTAPEPTEVPPFPGRPEATGVDSPAPTVEPFESLIARTEGLVRRVLRRNARAADVDDLVQETYLRAWRALPAFRGESRVTSWLTRIALNVARNRFRDERRHALVLEPRDLAAPAADSDQHDAALEHAYRSAVDRLPADLRTVFLLHEGEGLAYREVAERLGCPIGTVMSRLHRARARLLDDLRDRLSELTP